MPYKKKFVLPALMLAINISLPAVTEKDSDVIKLKLQCKIPAVSEKQNVYILPKDKVKYTDKGDILVLSRKYCTIYRFDSQWQYTGSFLKAGEGPHEITYPQIITTLSNNGLLILNDDKFIFYEMKKDQLPEIARIKVPYSNIGDIEEYNQEKLFVLTAYPLAPGLKGSDAGKFVHIYDLENKKDTLDFFDAPGEISRRIASELRSEYGSGDIIYSDNLLFLVFNQPGEMYIFKPDGTIQNKFSTRFPFVKYNTADVKRVEQDGNISIRMNYATTCQMNLFLQNKKVFLVTRINHGKGDAPLYHFYLSLLDYKKGKFINHLKAETAGVDISKSEFKCANDQSLVFLDENFLYSFSLD
ncbi:MAG TPA: hypothetical protein VK469_21875 [Candidatus Kapabacteria bacterium]|nr:hypothetical protein [Candidatus Kapabacteria bacterium]